MRPEKVFAAQQIGKLIEESGSLILTSFGGLDSAKMTRLRRTIREKAGRYFVVKNRLLAIAAREHGLDGLCALLKGQVGVVFGGDDWLGTLKTITDFAKQNEELKVLGGVCESKVRTAREMALLSALPPREVVAGQFIGTLVSPLSEFVQVLGEPVRSLVLVLGSPGRSPRAGAQEGKDSPGSQEGN